MKPKLRDVRVQPVVQGARRGVVLSDPLDIGRGALFVPADLAPLLTLMDGTRDLGALRCGFELRCASALSGSVVEQVVSQLDQALLLENERFASAYESALVEYRSARSRAPSLSGRSYPAAAAELSDFLQHCFGSVDREVSEGLSSVRGLVSPHIDFQRGGRTYARVWAEAAAAVAEADLVVILGTDHNEGEGRITLTRQDYETPWGLIPTAEEVVQELVEAIGDGAFACELNHRSEHSIESALVWLHYLKGDRPCALVPILCGSFQRFIERGESPSTAARIASTVRVLRGVCERRGAIIVAAADLAHMGPAFGDPFPLGLGGRAAMARQDEELMGAICSGDAEAFYARIAEEGDRRHVCGVPPIYVALSVLSGAVGTALCYEQCPASDDGSSLVSICGVLYRGTGTPSDGCL